MRLHDWSIQFEAFTRARRYMPFAWGTNDCCTFAADCAEALMGNPCAASLRGHSTAKQAYRSLKKHGGVAGIATAALGQPVPILSAQVGDVVLSKAGKRDMLAICNGGNCLAPSANGMVSLGMDTATMCWRVS